MNARLQAEAGDKAGASEGLRQAVALSRAIETAGQKIVAQIVIIQKQIECGDQASARALLQEAVPFALSQPEPLRSRSLAMFVASQVKAGDVTGAAGTMSFDPRLSGTRETQSTGDTCRLVRDCRRPRNRADVPSWRPAIGGGKRAQE